MPAPKPIHKTSANRDEHRFAKHRFEHWYADNQVNFITARCRDRTPAFASETAKAVFWDRFAHYTQAAGFTPWITSLLDNHYHTLGYNRTADALKIMMQRLHGSVAKLANDILVDSGGTRLASFWRDKKGREFFDGCIRDEKQCRRAYRYTLTQCVRHGICNDPSGYPHTRIGVELDRGVRRALELGAFMENVPYPRYRKG